MKKLTLAVSIFGLLLLTIMPLQAGVPITIMFDGVEENQTPTLTPATGGWKATDVSANIEALATLKPDILLRDANEIPTLLKVKTPDTMKDITGFINAAAFGADTEYPVPTYSMFEDADHQLNTTYKQIFDKKAKIKDLWIATLKSIAGSGVLSAVDWGNVTFDIEYKATDWNVIIPDFKNSASFSGTITLAETLNEATKSFNARFSVPTDPVVGFYIQPAVRFKWSLTLPLQADSPVGPLSVGSITIGNENDKINAMIGCQVLDDSPPLSFGFTPNVLFGTSGDTLTKIAGSSSGFAERLAARNITSIPANQENLTLLVADNSQYSYLEGRGVLHDRAKINAMIYAETYVSQITNKESEATGRKITRMEKSTNEYFKGNGEPSPGIGQFVWVGPINLREYYAWGGSASASPISDLDTPLLPSSTSESNSDSEAKTIHIWQIPLADLEKALHKRLLVQYKGTVDTGLYKDRRSAFLSPHFASACYFEYLNSEMGPAHFIDDLVYNSDSQQDLHLGGFDVLRFTAAVSDASGNWLLPSPTFVGPASVVNPIRDVTELAYKKTELDGSFKLAPYLHPDSSKRRPVLEHAFQLPLVVFDNDKPNPMIIMTAKGKDGTTRTTRFYIPNGDLADIEKNPGADSQQPWTNDDQVWEFDWEGNSPVMKWLADHDRERYEDFKQALQIQENSRLVFEVVAYDNINKWLYKDDPFCFNGIITPIVFPEGTKDESMVRPTTWKIIDETVEADPQMAELLYEDPKAKTYVYPDYIYRNVEENKNYGVEVTVHDRSNFNNPEENEGTTFNWRTLRLKFKVNKDNTTWQGVEKLGTEEGVNNH